MIGVRKKRSSAYVLITCISMMLAGHAMAQLLSPLHSFNNTNDGRYADNELVLSDGTLYGTAQVGGSLDRGTIFSISTDGTGFTIIHHFSATADPPYTNTDGAYPEAGLIVSGNTLYGTTSQGGTSVVGTVFRVNTDGTSYTNLHNFISLPYNYPISTNDEGAYPTGGLALSGETLYGTTPRGGTLGNGTVFAVRIDGDGFTNLHNFTPSEGYNSRGGLVLSGETLYGATYDSTPGSGTVFKLNTNGADFTILHRFADIPNYPSPSTNSDGSGPFGGLILSGNALYGTTTSGGSEGNGTVFAINTDGTGFTNLYVFPATSGEPRTNSDGVFPQAGLILSRNVLFGTAVGGGNYGAGTIFAINTNGTDFTVLHHFPIGEDAPINLHINADGSFPRSGLLFSDFTLYGTAGEGGGLGYGTVYSLSLRPQLTITASGTNVVLTWPEHNVGFTTGFTLESATNLNSSATWNLVAPGPTVVNGLNMVTNPIWGSHLYYRLRQ